MSVSRSTHPRLLALCIGLGCAGTASAATYTVTTPGTNTVSAVGQNFSPSIGGPGPEVGSSVFLDAFQFSKGNGATGNANTRLAVLPGEYYDTNGGDGTFQPTIANATAISTNTVDTAAAAEGATLDFTFAGATLTYGDSYTVAFATVGAGDVLTFIPVAVRYVNYVETAPGSGVYVPTENYGGTGNYNASTLYPDSDANGYFQADNNAADLAFTATFSSVPEPASLAAAVGAIALIARRRR